MFGARPGMVRQGRLCDSFMVAWAAQDDHTDGNHMRHYVDPPTGRILVWRAFGRLSG